MRVNPFWKDMLREIWKTKARCASLIIITMLGAMSVVGIRATAINMRDAADREYKSRSLYDIQIRSIAGFNEDDLSAVTAAEGVAAVMPAYVIDVYFDMQTDLRPTRTYSLPDELNRIELVSGCLPENALEVAVEQRMFRAGRFSIGDKVEFSLSGLDLYSNIFYTSEFTITGVVSSPLYMTFERGRTTLGNGTLQYYAYLHPDAYKADVYTDIFVQMEESAGLHNVSEEYKAAADGWKQRFEDISPDWFVLTRENGTAFESYYQDTLRLQSVGYVFPMVFYLVAILVSLTSMTRLVEEHRTQIGVFGALGFRSAAIMLKYLMYALLCSISGSVLGVIAGSRLFPLIIGDAYGHLYEMPPMEMPIPLGIASFAVAISVISLTAASLLTCVGTMLGEPADLMRPKAPKAGKRVLLERIQPLWNKMGFIGKVTARNIFRYKRRFLMTLIGVAGCAALLLTAFGLRDSIGSVALIQYGDVVEYDAIVYTVEVTTNEQRDLLEALTPETRLFIREESVAVGSGSGGTTAALIIPEDFLQLGDYINFIDPKTGRSLDKSTTGALITEKLARTWDVEAGDTFILTTPDGAAFAIEAAGIVENYIQHFVYLPLEEYRDIFDRDFKPNAILLRGDTNAEELLENRWVRAVIQTANMVRSISDSTDVLSVVTIVLLVLACALAFVVLFNLTLINITERRRELATIKVLGFQDNETATYIYREILFITLMGIAVGLAGGVVLTTFVLRSVEVDILKFPHILRPVSFVLSAALSLVFAIFVNIVTYRRLTSIDMVESLKDVE